MPKRARKNAGPAGRVRHLVALDAANVMRRLANRHEEMVALFSRLRDRAPMVETVQSWFETAGFPELVLLDPGEQAAINSFYDELAELRWYFQYTEDMPNAVLTTTGLRVKRLVEAHERLTGVIGHPLAHGEPSVEVKVVVHDPPVPEKPALPAPAKARRSR